MRLSRHQQVSWPLTVKAVTNQQKTSMLTDTALRNLKERGAPATTVHPQHRYNVARFLYPRN
jgi:hypothetical protein